MVKCREFESSKIHPRCEENTAQTAGKGNRPNATEPTDASETALLKENGLLGVDNPDKLINL